MTDIYTQENGSKKKFLAPVLVILLCMVSLTAAGYAYSATVNNTGDDVVIEGVTLELTDNAGNILDRPMVNITGEGDFTVDIATHTTNGHALWYSKAYGFVDASTYKQYGEGEGKIATVDGFGTGYYVEVLKNGVGTNIGYNDDVYTTAAALTAAVNTHGVFQVGDAAGYKLNTVNQSDADVDVTATISGLTEFAGLQGLYAVVTGTVAGEAIATPILWDMKSDATATLVNDLADGKTAELVIKLYVVLTDYYAPTLPTLPLDVEFAFEFEAVTA